MQHPENRNTKPVNFINFHGLTLLVVAHQGVDYVPARPLAELAGMQWKGAQRSLNEGDNAKLYGTCRLIPPVFAGHGTTGCPETGIPYIRLDRARMFLARVSTNNMRAKGGHEAADQLLALQTEWAQVLHRYETHGVAIKAGRSSALRDLIGLAKVRDGMADPRERKAFTHLLHEEMRALGLPLDTLDSPQGSLPLTSAAG